MLLSECRVAIFINMSKVGLLRTAEVSSSDRPCVVFTAQPTAKRRLLGDFAYMAAGRSAAKDASSLGSHSRTTEQS